MSKLTIVDLHKAEELSSSEMANATGGMDEDSCAAAKGAISDGFRSASNALFNMGFYDGACNLMDGSHSVLDGPECP